MTETSDLVSQPNFINERSPKDLKEFIMQRIRIPYEAKMMF